jgi:predicted DNA-binding transcriptional regulator AlpA
MTQPTTELKPLLLNTRQVAAALHISERQVFRLIQKRIIQPVKLGTSLRVKTKWLESWVDQLSEDELAHLQEM